jgi:hypothetical protein
LHAFLLKDEGLYTIESIVIIVVRKIPLPNHLSLSFSESIAVILFYMGIITRSKSTALAATATASSPTPPPINYIAVVVKACRRY